MEINELYLKTAFCCMACDGEIASEELELVKHFAESSSYFENMNVQSKLNEYVSEINGNGHVFLKGFINNVCDLHLNEQQELELAKIAIKMIESDNKIEYSEISFFKQIRGKLNVSDEKLMDVFRKETLFNKFPEVKPEDFLLPDIAIIDDWDFQSSFEKVNLLEVP